LIKYKDYRIVGLQSKGNIINNEDYKQHEAKDYLIKFVGEEFLNCQLIKLQTNQLLCAALFLTSINPVC